MKKYLPTIVIGAVILAVIGFVVFALVQPEATPGATVAADPAKLADGPSQGPANAKVVVTEFGDYQCPACLRDFPTLNNQVLPQFNGQIKFVFLNYPLSSIHKNAQAAAQAAMAANVQGKFWEMHDKLYEKHGEWAEVGNPKSKFEAFAQELGLNVDQFKKDSESGAVKDIIAANVALGDAFKLQGTPSYFVNGQPVPGIADLTAAIKKALGQ